MKRNQHLKIVVALWAALWCSAAQAAFIGTYAAATAGPGGNTVRTSDGDTGSTNTWLYDGGASTWGDTQWFYLGMGGGWSGATGTTFFANKQDRTDGTSAPALTMTVTPFDPLGIYNVYLVYETDDTTAGGSTPISTVPYDIHAGLSPSSLTLFDSSSGGYTGGSREIVPGGRYLNEREVFLGIVTNSTISVYVDDSVQPAGSVENQTRWEGIAFLQIGAIPEPSVTLLLGVGGLVLWRRIRK